MKFAPDGTQRWAYRYNGPGERQRPRLGAGRRRCGQRVRHGLVLRPGLRLGDAEALARRSAAAGSAGSPAPGFRRRCGRHGACSRTATSWSPAVTQNTGDGQTNDAETVAYDAQGAIVWRARWTDTAASHELISDLDVDASGRIALTGTTAPDASPYVVPSPVTLRYDTAAACCRRSAATAGPRSTSIPRATSTSPGSPPQGTPSVAKYDAAGSRAWTAPLGTSPASSSPTCSWPPTRRARSPWPPRRAARARPTAASGRSGSPPTAVSCGGTCSTAATIPASRPGRRPRDRQQRRGAGRRHVVERLRRLGGTAKDIVTLQFAR